MSIDCPCCKKPIIVSPHSSEDDENSTTTEISPSYPTITPLFLPCGHYFCGRPECLEKLSELKDSDDRLKLKIYVITCPMCLNKPYRVTVTRDKTLLDHLSEGEEAKVFVDALKNIEKIAFKSPRHSTCKKCKSEYVKYCEKCGDRFCEKCDGEEHKDHTDENGKSMIVDIPAAMKKVDEDITRCHDIFSKVSVNGEGEYDVTEKLYTEYTNGVTLVEKTFDDLIADLERKKKEILESTVKMYREHFATVNGVLRENRRCIGGAAAACMVLDSIKDLRRYKPLFDWKNKAEDFIKSYDKINFAQSFRDVPYQKQLNLRFVWSQKAPKLENVDISFMTKSFNSFNNTGMFAIKSASSLALKPSASQPIKTARREGLFNTFVPAGVQAPGHGPYTAGFRMDANGQNYTVSKDTNNVEASDEVRNDTKNYSTIVLGDAAIPADSEITFAFRVTKLPHSSGVFVGVSTNEFDYERQTNWKKAGWFFHTSTGMLFSCLPHSYAGVVFSEPRRSKVGDVIIGIINTEKRTLSFRIKYVNSEEVVDLGVAYTDIPLTKPIYPAAIISRGCAIEFDKEIK